MLCGAGTLAREKLGTTGLCGAGALARAAPNCFTSERTLEPKFIRHSLEYPFRTILKVQIGAQRPPHMLTPHTAAPFSKYQYRRRLPHLQKEDAPVFVTFCTGGCRILPGPARDLVLDHCLREGGLEPFAGEGARATPARIHLYAVVVMPEHVHLLFLPLRDREGWPFPMVDILQCLKGATAHRVNKLLHTSGPVWEEESFDHVLRSDESLKQKCEYIRQNPVEAGLVKRPEDYRWLWINPELQ